MRWQSAWHLACGRAAVGGQLLLFVVYSRVFANVLPGNDNYTDSRSRVSVRVAFVIVLARRPI
jgi:hypothetical protein